MVKRKSNLTEIEIVREWLSKGAAPSESTSSSVPDGYVTSLIKQSLLWTCLWTVAGFLMTIGAWRVVLFFLDLIKRALI